MTRRARPLNRRRFLSLAGMAGGMALGGASRAGLAAGPGLAVVYNYGPVGKFDKSFNEAAFRGVVRARDTRNAGILEYEPRDADEQATFLDAAIASGRTVIAIGSAHGAAVQRIAASDPSLRLAIIDGAVEAPNVLSITFREEQGSFLVGMAAGLATSSGVVAFIGGMDLPVIHRFRAGFMAGVEHVLPDATIHWQMTGTTHRAFNDPIAGIRIAQEMIDKRADVLFAAAGSTGLGVYQAARDAGVFAIGVDSNQNYLQPGTMLTSMIKRVDRAVEIAVDHHMKSAWHGGPLVLGLVEGGVDYAIDRHNRALITEDMETRIDRARREIVAGRLDVPGPG